RPQLAGGRLRVPAGAEGALRRWGEACPRCAGTDLDRVHARSEARGIHGLAAPHRARRGAVVAGGDAKLGRLPEAPCDSPGAARDPRRELPRAVQPAGLAPLGARDRVGPRLAIEAAPPLAELLRDDLAVLLGAVPAELEQIGRASGRERG